MDRLPTELFYIICSHIIISDGHSTLRGCTLLSRRWLKPARHYLFAFLTARIDDSERPQILTHFLEPYPYLAKYVRKLTMTTRWWPNTYDSCSTTSPGVHQLLNHLPRLRALHLYSISILPPEDQPLFPSISGPRPHLDRLVLDNVSSGMIPLFSLISSLRADHVDICWSPTLRIYSDDDDDAEKLIPQGSIEKYIPPFEIRSLCLCFYLDAFTAFPHVVFDTLQKLLPRATMRSFRYKLHGVEGFVHDVPFLTPVLHNLRTTITDLGLSMGESRLECPCSPPLTTSQQTPWGLKTKTY